MQHELAMRNIYYFQLRLTAAWVDFGWDAPVGFTIVLEWESTTEYVTQPGHFRWLHSFPEIGSL